MTARVTWQVELLEADPIALHPGQLFGRKGHDRLQQLVLALAVAYNDLRDLIVVMDWLARMPNGEGEVERLRHQRNGMQIQQGKRQISCIHAVLELLKEFNDVANGPEMRAIIAEAPPGVRVAWDMLLGIANDAKSTSGSVGRKLEKIRHSFGAHYHQPKALLRGYQRRFFQAPTHHRAQSAVFSIGANLAATRFHFADAAVEGGIFDVVGSSDTREFVAEFGEVIQLVNGALFGVVHAYLAACARGEQPSIRQT